jgi:hypothetical protein
VGQNSGAQQLRPAGVAATTITRLARTDARAAALSLDLEGEILTVLLASVEDLLEAMQAE